MSNHPTRPDKAPDSGFDVGTRPHGLSADLALPHQKTPSKPRNPLPALACSRFLPPKTVFPNLEQFFSRFALLVFLGYASLSVLLFRFGAPPWLVDLPQRLLPSSLRRAGALAYQQRRTA